MMRYGDPYGNIEREILKRERERGIL